MARLRFNKDVHLLFVCQALAMTGTSVVATTSALAAQTIAATPELVTLPLALQFLSTMLSTAPASFLMRRIGRRAGFTCGIAIIVTASLLSAYALAIANFPLFCLGGALIGSFNAFAMYYRFTAAEVAPEALRGKAISYVMAGGVVAAIFGPQLSNWAKDVLAPIFFAGSYLVVAALSLAALALLRFIRVPNLTVEERRDTGRPLAEIARQPIFLVAVLGAMLGYSSMTMVMTATPLAMAECGHSFGETAWVFQWHILGMYGPAFFIGHLIHRIGVLNVMLMGVVLMLACVGIDLTGVEVTHFWFGLALLGLGWSCLFVASTNFLTYSYRSAERAKVQAVNETCVFAAVAFAAWSSGAVEHLVSWNAVNLAILPSLFIVSTAILWLRFRRRPFALELEQLPSR